MYSVILAAMLSGGAQQAEAWHWHRASCHGSSCVGSCYGGCHGYTVGCSGCYGGCTGYGCTGYGCSGFTGYTVGYTYWASGCYGSSCFGGCYGCTGGIGCHGWTGGFAAVPYHGGIVVGSTTYVPSTNVHVGTAVTPKQTPATTPMVPVGDKAPSLPPVKLPEGVKPIPENSVSASNAARVVVHVPADAKVWVDQVACPLSGTTRAFNTPTLLPGAQYAYTIAIETASGGRQERRVTMSAGRTVEVDFRDPSVETVQK